MKKGHHLRAGIEAVLVCPPCLERAAGHVQHLGRLALGDPLSAQLTIALKQVSALKALPCVRMKFYFFRG